MARSGCTPYPGCKLDLSLDGSLTGTPAKHKDVGIMLTTILVPLDGSPLAERALTYAAALARRSDANIVLVEAVQTRTLPGVDQGVAQLQITSRAEEHLRTSADRLSAQGISTETHVYDD